MSEDKKISVAEQDTTNTSEKAAQTVASDVYGDRKSFGQKGGRKPGGRGPKRGNRDDRPRDEFEQRILEIARVTRVMAGGKRMNFRACVAIGDKKGSVGIGLGKGADVTIAVNKAVNKAKKTMIKVSTTNETIPHAVTHKSGAAKILIKPAAKGRGVISGGVVRVIMDLAGIANITTKTLGTNNKINNARCTIEALSLLRKVENKHSDKTKKEEVVQEKKEKKSATK